MNFLNDSLNFQSTVERSSMKRQGYFETLAFEKIRFLSLIE